MLDMAIYTMELHRTIWHDMLDKEICKGIRPNYLMWYVRHGNNTKQLDQTIWCDMSDMAIHKGIRPNYLMWYVRQGNI